MSEKMYTEAEAMLMADRAAMTQKINEMAHRIESTERATKEGFSDIKIQITALASTVEKQLTAEEARREKHKLELTQEFASKLEIERLSHKVDTMWVRITTIVVAVVAVGGVAQYFLVTADRIRSLIGQ